MLPDVVLPCRPGPNEELRYALRSLQNLPHRNVWIIGGMPDWVRGVRFFEYPRATTGYETVEQHMRTACNHPEISDPFILMNDDFYIMKLIKSVPTLNRGTVREVLAEHERQGITVSTYVTGMQGTLARLEQQGYQNPLSFELHMPMLIPKKAMLDAIEMCVGIPRGHLRTAVGAIAGMRGKKARDVKVYGDDDPIPSGRFLSSNDHTFEHLLPTLQAVFPQPGPYEA